MLSTKPMILFAAIAGLAVPAIAQEQPADEQAPAAEAAAEPAHATVGGAEMDPAATIVQNISKSAVHTQLVKLLTASGVDQALAAAGPFTLFAPDDDAFGRLAPGTVDTLLKPENKATLAKVLNYHVVSGTLSVEDIEKQAQASGGTATLTTLAGQPLQVSVADGVIKITDANNNVGYVSQGDIKSANGLIHVTNGVLLPKL